MLLKMISDDKLSYNDIYETVKLPCNNHTSIVGSPKH